MLAVKRSIYKRRNSRYSTFMFDRLFNLQKIHTGNYPAYIKKGYYYNFRVHVLDVSLYITGMHIASKEVIIPAFLKSLGAPTLLISLLPALSIIGLNFPKILGSFHVQGKARVKPLLMISGLFQRAPWLPVAFVLIGFGTGNNIAVMVLFVLLMLISYFVAGYANPAWSELIAKSIPQKRRGIFMASIISISSALAVAGGVYVKIVMESERITYPNNYALLFGSVGVILFISYFFFSLNNEPHLEHEVTPELQPRQFISEIKTILKKDKEFRNYLFARILSHANIIGISLLMVFTLEHFNLNNDVTGNFTLVITISGVMASLVIGLFVDKFGHKFGLLVSNISYLLCIFIALCANNLFLMYLSFMFLAVNESSFKVSGNNIIFEFAKEGKRPMYVGITGLVVSPFILLYSITGGLVAGTGPSGFMAAFIISLIITTAGAILLSVTSGPRKRNEKIKLK